METISPQFVEKGFSFVGWQWLVVASKTVILVISQSSTSRLGFPDNRIAFDIPRIDKR
jgi:hypothetical protein